MPPNPKPKNPGSGAAQTPASPFSADAVKKEARAPAPNTPLKLLIDGEWFDLSVWQHTHPGGAEVLQHVNGGDATDVFFALHSQDAIRRLKRLPKAAQAPSAPKEDPVKDSFRLFRQQLESEGFFKRSLLWEVLIPLHIVALIAVGSWIAPAHPFVAMLLVGLAMQQAGWAGHDYCHGRGQYCWVMGRLFGGIVNGFSSAWWGRKHNNHHAHPNWFEVDDDIANDPVFHLWIPEEDKDHWFRQYQHIYFLPVCAFIYASWRIQSIQFVRESKDVLEIALIVVGYAMYLAILPIHVFIGAVLVGGFLVGIVVTASHQSEELIDVEEAKAENYNFVRDQFATTRDVYTPNPFLIYLWGGMSTQTVHHLFPIMPRYYYPTVFHRVKAWAAANGVEYKVDGPWEIIWRNLMTMKKFAQARKKAE